MIPSGDSQLEHFVGRRASGLGLGAFQLGTLSASKDIARRKLQSILKKPQLPKGDLHAFGHGRVSFLRANRVPDDLIMEWIGNSNLA